MILLLGLRLCVALCLWCYLCFYGSDIVIHTIGIDIYFVNTCSFVMRLSLEALYHFTFCGYGSNMRCSTGGCHVYGWKCPNQLMYAMSMACCFLTYSSARDVFVLSFFRTMDWKFLSLISYISDFSLQLIGVKWRIYVSANKGNFDPGNSMWPVRHQGDICTKG